MREWVGISAKYLLYFRIRPQAKVKSVPLRQGSKALEASSTFKKKKKRHHSVSGC